jgi:integrase
VLKEPKTKSGKRTIALPTGVIETLKAVLVDQNKRCLKLGVGKSNDGYVFDDWHRRNGKHGNPTPPHYVTTAFIRRIAKLDVPRVRFHDLRHTHIRQLLLDGHPVLAVAKRAGHKSTQMTLDVYGHLLKGFDKAMIEDFDRELEQVKYKRSK